MLKVLSLQISLSIFLIKYLQIRYLCGAKKCDTESQRNTININTKNTIIYSNVAHVLSFC